MKLRLNPPYLLLAGGIFLIEVVIAAFVHDRWVRPFGGDLLVVMLLHFLARGVSAVSARTAAIGTFIFACAVEAGQWLQLAQRLGVERHWIGRLLLGTTFHWGDIVVYGLGAGLAWWVDQKLSLRRSAG